MIETRLNSQSAVLLYCSDLFILQLRQFEFLTPSMISCPFCCWAQLFCRLRTLRLQQSDLFCFCTGPAGLLSLMFPWSRVFTQNTMALIASINNPSHWWRKCEEVGLCGFVLSHVWITTLLFHLCLLAQFVHSSQLTASYITLKQFQHQLMVIS